MILTLSIIAVALLLIIVFQVSKILEQVSLLRGEQAAEERSNRINGLLFFLIGTVGLILVFWSVFSYQEHFLPPAASEHGSWIDGMFNLTLLFTGIVFVATQLALFYFAYRYQHKKGTKAYFYPDNDRLEIIWTVIPSIVLTVLIVMGAYRWYQITGPAPEDAYVVEVTGRQFDWTARYPGEDGKLGDYDFRKITGLNLLGLLKNDARAHDDVVTQSELHIPVDQPVLIKIRARDVLHSVYLPHFRVKMDAVPGIPTQFWFTPKYTTEEMREKTDNPDFNYELACAELCGKGHSSMKLNVVVEPEDSVNKWLSELPTWKEAMQQAEQWKTLQSQEEEVETATQKEHTSGEKLSAL